MKLRSAVLATGAAALIGCGGQEPQEPAGQPGAQEQAERDQRSAEQRAETERRRREEAGRTARVTEVIDGDTIELEGVGRVRLTGVDTPERGEECFEEATDYLRGRVGGRTVRYRYQQERTDRYDRALLDIFRGGQLVNLDIAQSGWGEELTIQPNDRYSQRIAAAEHDARAEPRGGWAGCVDEPQPAPSAPTPPPAQEHDDPRGGAGGSLPPPPPDLDCSDLDGPVAVGPDDPHRLDADGDGTGCD